MFSINKDKEASQVNIGERLKNLRVQKGLTQEELGERTDLTKGYISQIERNLSSPSMETFFSLLEVLGCEPTVFFQVKKQEQRVVYGLEERTCYVEEEKNYKIEWLVPESNENEMEPILLTFEKNGEFKQFAPSLSDTFALVLKGRVEVRLGHNSYYAQKGETIYYRAKEQHQIFNRQQGETQMILVATNSYL